jgi:hypothetical protein
MPTARELIAEARKYINNVHQALKLATKAYDKINDDLSYATSRLNFKKRSDYPNIFMKSLLGEVRRTGRLSTILKEEIQQALETNIEFSKEYYTKALYTVADDLDIFNIKFLGSGWRTKANVVITFEEGAGSLEDWSRGVSLYREALGVEVEQGSNRGARATRYWVNTVFRNYNLSQETFKGRIDYAGRPAPFWQILNSGTPASLTSDRGDGSYNPLPAVPTDFIGTAESRIAVMFSDILEGEHTQWKKETAFLESDLRDARLLLIDIEELIEKLKADDTLDNYIIQRLNSRSKSGDIFEYADRDKILKAVQKYRAGEEFTTSTIELTAKNAAKRVRPRVSTFIRLIEGYEDL